MKKVCFIGVLLLATFAFAQYDTVAVQGFESGMAPWATYRTAGSGTMWAIEGGSSPTPHTGDSLAHQTFCVADSTASWLVSPLLNLSGVNSELRFWEQEANAVLHQYHGVYVSTTNRDPSLGGYTEVEEVPAAGGSWTEHVTDLSAYDGSAVYVALLFYEHNADDWYVDDIVVRYLSPTAGYVRGYADLTDTPGADAGIRVFLSDSSYFDLTDPAGAYFINAVPAGSYVAFATMDDYSMVSSAPFTVVAGDMIDLDTLFLDPVPVEDFETTDGGLVPDPTTGAWEWGAPSALNEPVPPHSGTQCWSTIIGGDYNVSADWTLDIPLHGHYDYVSWWQWYDIETDWDGGNVKISTDNGSTWQLITGIGYDDLPYSDCPLYPDSVFTGHPATWEQIALYIGSYDSVSFVRFHFGSNGSVTYPGWYIDDLSYYEVNKGRLEGRVFDHATYEAIGGALVAGPVGISTYTDAMGYFRLDDVPIGTYDITAYKAGCYFPQTMHNVPVSDAGAYFLYIPMWPIEYDMLGNPELSYSYDDTANVITICNTSQQSIDYTAWVSNNGPVSGGLYRLPTISGDIPAATSDKWSSVPISGATRAPSGTAPLDITTGLRRAVSYGDVIDTITLDSPPIANPWGLSREDNMLWIGCYITAPGPRNFEMNWDGTWTGTSYTWNDARAYDMGWDGYYILQMKYNSGKIFRWDPITGDMVDSLSDPAMSWDTWSWNSVAYDAASDFYIISGWDYGGILRIKGWSWTNPGEVYDGVLLGGVASVAWHSGRGTIFANVSAPAGVEYIYEIDPTTWTIVNSIAAPGLADFSGAGLDIDNDGNILYLNQNDGKIYVIETGVPLLPLGMSVFPRAGTLAPGECVTFSMAGRVGLIPPGEYDLVFNVDFGNLGIPMQIPLDFFVSPEIQRGWNMVSVPVAATPNDPWTQLHDDIDPFGVSGTHSDIYAWDPVDGRYTAPYQFKRAEGYYLWSWHNHTLFDVYGTAYTSDTTLTLYRYASSTKPGWHLIGNPFNRRISWDAVVADPAFNNVSTTYYVWTNAGWATYSPGVPMGASKMINPWQGFMVIVTSPTFGTLPFKNTYTYGALAKKSPVAVKTTGKNKLVKALDDAPTLQPFILRVSAESRSGSDVRYDTWNYLEVADGSLDAFDPTDIEEPDLDLPGAIIRATFREGTKDLLADRKALFTPEVTKEWSMHITGGPTGSSVVTLSWPMHNPLDPADGSMGIDEISDDYTLQLIVNGTTYDMRENSSVSFIYEGPTNVVVRVSSSFPTDVEETMVPKVYSLAQNLPNPFNASTEITIGLPNDDNVSLEVYNIIGQKVNTLVSGEMKAGYHHIVWDGTDDMGSVLPSGVYLYRVKTDRFTDSKKMMLVK